MIAMAFPVFDLSKRNIRNMVLATKSSLLVKIPIKSGTIRCMIEKKQKK
tara:strand:- start:964 stop:1110 length:147 start_codon:yes stop_codon:yes gene_type:complete